MPRLRQFGREKGGELHRQGRGAARTPAGPARANRARDREPVDPTVRPETAILGLHHRVADGGSNGLQGHPAEAAALTIDPFGVEQPAIAVVEPRLAGCPVGAQIGVGGHSGRAEERRVGKEWGRRGSSWWWRYHSKKTNT